MSLPALQALLDLATPVDGWMMDGEPGYPDGAVGKYRLAALAPVMAAELVQAEAALSEILGHDEHLNAIWQLGAGQDWKAWTDAKNRARAALARLASVDRQAGT